MILLPDIHINIIGTEHKLSLQDPYTLNGKLITHMYISSGTENSYATDAFGERLYTVQTNVYNSIQIADEEGYCVVISQVDLERYMAYELHHFFREQGNEFVEVGENRRYMWTIRRDYGFSNYIRDLERQCNEISRRSITVDGTSYIGRCRERLRNQGRLQEENNARTATISQDWYYSPTLSTSHRSHAEGVATRVTRNPYTYGYGQPVNNYSFVVREPSVQKKHIHQYNYKPEYIKHYMPDEDESALLLGAEIEVDCGGESEEHAKKVLEIMCGINPDDAEEVLENKMYCTHDGSLRNGIEFDTMPCTLEYHRQEMRYKEMFEYLDKNGYKAHDTDTCGLHIHADRNYLGNSELKQQLVITKILYILEKFNDEICVIARRNNNYSQFVGEGKNEKSAVELYKKYKDKGKHVALNLTHKETIEFRCFKGTLKYETFLLTLEFVKNIIDYAKSVNIEDIELIQWSDLTDIFSDELVEYYNDRLEKEMNKEPEKIKLDENNSRITVTPNSWNIDAVSSSVSSLSSGTLSFSTTFDNESYSRLSDILFGSASSQSSSILDQTTNQNTEEDNEIETKKKEIKLLKKRIKNSRNYMEKTRLNAELTQAQKELKKLKKNKNTNSNSNNSNDTCDTSEYVTTVTLDRNRCSFDINSIFINGLDSNLSTLNTRADCSSSMSFSF